MSNNDVLRSLRYLLHVNDTKLIEILGLADYEVSPVEITAFLKREDEYGYEPCGHEVMAAFLNGLVVFKRGRDESRGAAPVEVPITNNIVLKKLRVAFALKDTDIIALIEKAGQKISKTELSAFFRRPDHGNYRECGDQFLRAFLKGLTP